MPWAIEYGAFVSMHNYIAHTHVKQKLGRARVL